MIELTDTNSAAIAAEFVRARIRAGSPAMGMVMTMVIVVDEDVADDVMKVAREASHEHPARVLGVILGDGRGAAQVNAQVGAGSGWSGETALIRLKGEVVKHPESVVLPLLLPDSPVAIYWPTDPPDDPAATRSEHWPSAGSPTLPVRPGEDPGDPHPVRELHQGQHRPRLDPDHAVARAARGLARPAPPQGHLRLGRRRADQPQRRPARRLARRPAQGRASPVRRRRARASPRWCSRRRRARSGSPAPTASSRRTPRPGHPDRPVALKRRDLPELLGEELRRLDEDDVYARTARRLLKMGTTK